MALCKAARGLVLIESDGRPVVGKRPVSISEQVVSLPSSEQR